jgi:hypothetical protein
MKKIFRLIWLFTIMILTAATISACNKNSNAQAGTYSVSMSVNGVQKQFTVQAIAVFATISSNDYTVAVEGANSLIQGSTGMAINITNPTAISSGVNYTDANVSINGNEVAQAVLQYTDTAGHIYSSAYFNSPGVIVTFSQINSTIVKGTFSGTLQLQSGGGIPLTITNGQFAVKGNL